MIFKRGRRRSGEPEVVEADEPEEGDEPERRQAEDAAASEVEADDLTRLDYLEWRGSGPWDIGEIDSIESSEESPRIDLGSMVITGVPGSELRLQVSEETGDIVSAMLVISTIVEAPASAHTPPQAYSSALELGAYAAPRSGGLWAELRDEISQGATEAGGSASLAEGPFGVELRRFVPVRTPDGEEGYQPSRMWVAEGPRWLLRGIVYGQAAIEDDNDSPVVADVLAAFRHVVVRRGDEAMAPGDLLPLTMPAELVTGES